MSAATRIPIVLSVVCLLLSPSVAHAQTGVLTGTVVEDGTLTPLFGTGPQAFRVAAYTLAGTLAAAVETDATGYYRIATLEPASYFVKVSIAPGHVAELHPDIACIAADCPVTAGTPVVITANTTTTVDFSLAREGIITGTARRAVDASGIGGLTINIYNASTSFVMSAITASDGTYVAKGLAAGSYFALATSGVNPPAFDFVTELYGGVLCPHLAPASDCRIVAGTPIGVTAGAFTAGVDFSLDKGASIAGKVVVDGSTTPLAGVGVTAYAGEVSMGSAVTDASGNYTIVGLPPGRYRIRTAVTSSQNYVDEWQNGLCVACSGAMTSLTVTAGQAVMGVDFSLTAGGTIRGTISCDTRTLPSGLQRAPAIDVFDATGRFVKTVVSPAVACSLTTPVPYTVQGLTTGTYFLWAKDVPNLAGLSELSRGSFVDQLYGGVPCNTADCDVRKGAPVTVSAGGTTAGIDFGLQAGGRWLWLSAVAGTKINIYDARGVEVINAVGVVSIAQPPSDIAAGLPPGTYYFTFNGHPSDVRSCLDCPPTAGIPVSIGPNVDHGSPTVAFTPGRVSGTVTNASGGAPLSTVTVELLSRSGKVGGRGTTDLFGHYTVTGLAPGTYFARTLNDRGFVDEVYLDAACGTCDPRSGAPIVVGFTTSATGIDFALASGGVVSGLVSDTAGNVLGNVPVSLIAGTTTFAGVKTTSPSGRYRLTLPAGTYRALAEASANFGSEVYSEMPCTSAGCDPSTGAPIAVTTNTVTDAINFTLTSCNAMTLSPSILAKGLNGRAYRQVFSATGGAGPYMFDVTDGILPLGLTLNRTTGRLEGTPTVGGRSTFRVSALDSNGCAADRAYVLDVDACAFALSPTSATVAAAGATVRVNFSANCDFPVIEGNAWIRVEPAFSLTAINLVIAPNTQGPRSTVISIARRTFEVQQAGTESQAPYGSLDLPLEGAQLNGAIAIGGWALDDLAVTRVRIQRDSVAGEPAGPVFIGNAVFVPGARPDVQQAYANVPRSDRAGFGYVILTNTLPNQGNGSFRIHAVAEDAEGHATLLGSRTIVINNAAAQQPFGTIDTPLQGETIAGSSYVNFGWALTPRPAAIAVDGSTIQVLIDGASIGTANYNFFRPDVSNAFPGLANSAGPVGHKTFDTTALAEGLHTIAWLVTDSRPATSGIGSRYFYVANSADAPPAGSSGVTTTETEVEATDVARPLGTAPAPDMGRHAASLAVAADATNASSANADATNASSANDVLITRGDGPARRLRVNDDGIGAVTLAPMERIALALGASDEACPSTWAGYLVKDGVLSDLPVGASLDPTGTFYWQTGPGFAGDFSLRFVRTNCRGEKLQIAVKVTIPLR